MAFIDGFLKLKDEVGVTAAELARATGVPKTTIDKIVQKKSMRPNVDDAVKLARYLGKSVEELCAPDRDGKLSVIAAVLPLLSEHDLDLFFSAAGKYRHKLGD